MRLRDPPGFDAVGEDARGQVQKAFTRGTVPAQPDDHARRDPAASARQRGGALDALLDARRPPEAAARRRACLRRRRCSPCAASSRSRTRRDAAASAELADALKAGVARAVAALAEARRAEGRALSGILAGQLDAMATARRCGRDLRRRARPRRSGRLAAQIAALLDAAPALDPDRLHQEAVLLAAKADMREEIDRLTRMSPRRASFWPTAAPSAAGSISWPRSSAARRTRCAPRRTTCR